MRLKVDGAWGRYDCIVNAPYSKGRAVHGRGKAICWDEENAKRGVDVPYFSGGL
jgi:hypothetical protein